MFFFAVLFIAVVATLYHELAHINFKQTLEAFSKINRWYLVGLFICGGSAMILLSLYDLILVKGLKLDIPLIRVLKSAISLMHLMPLLALVDL